MNAKLNQAEQASKQTNKYANNCHSENQMDCILWSIDSANHRISKKKLEYYVRLWMVKLLHTVIEIQNVGNAPYCNFYHPFECKSVRIY